MQIPKRDDPNYQEVVDRLGDQAERAQKLAAEFGLSVLSSSESYLLSAAEIVTRDPSQAKPLAELAYKLELEAAPLIAQEIWAIASK